MIDIKQIDRLLKITGIVISLYFVGSVIFFKEFFEQNLRMLYIVPSFSIIALYSGFSIYRGLKYGELVFPRVGLVKHKNKPGLYWFGFVIHSYLVLMGLGVFIAIVIFKR